MIEDLNEPIEPVTRVLRNQCPARTEVTRIDGRTMEVRCVFERRHQGEHLGDMRGLPTALLNKIPVW